MEKIHEIFITFIFPSLNEIQLALGFCLSLFYIFGRETYSLDEYSITDLFKFFYFLSLFYV